MKISEWESENLINGFIDARVVGRGLDGRTEKAYRLDLEQFYIWAGQRKETGERTGERNLGSEMEGYLSYLAGETSLRPATIYRKHTVLGLHLLYLAEQGVSVGCGPLKNRALAERRQDPEKMNGSSLLSKKEVDAFFQAISREYEELDSDFRRQVCLRDLVMMKLLFYHGIEISRLLLLEESDYNRATAVLTVWEKQEKQQLVRLFSKTLQEQMDQWLNEHEHFERGNEYDRRLFLSKLGRPLSMKMVIEIFDKYRTLAGIEKGCTPKDLKRSMKRYARETVMEQCG